MQHANIHASNKHTILVVPTVSPTVKKYGVAQSCENKHAIKHMRQYGTIFG